MKIVVPRLSLLFFALGMAMGCDSLWSASHAQEITIRSMLAAQIRSQGVTCRKPLRAVRDAKRSRPDYDVWILTCSNATYRISRYPDMAAKVVRLHKHPAAR
jgi:hypothetical protein